MKQKALFITGTDTGVGKTFYSCNLLHALNARGHTTLAMKPVAAGARFYDGILKNEDAIKLQKTASIKIPYAEVNPYCFSESIAPHLAATHASEVISIETLHQHYLSLTSKADVLLLEGVGGWQVPLNDKQTVADFAVKLMIPVVMVVGIRLGCINHALLTAKSIQQSGVPFAGWVANIIKPEMSALEENITTLQQKISTPLLDVINFQTEISDQFYKTIKIEWLENLLLN